MQWFRRTLSPRPKPGCGPRSYGGRRGAVQRFRPAVKWAALVAGLFLTLAAGTVSAAETPLRIVVLGDSLAAGLGLPAAEAFPAKLARALKAKGWSVDITDAAVSGDTASGGLARLDWSVPEGTDAVILELGANDMLRGLDPAVTRRALDEIVRRLKERRIAVFLAGMRAAPNLGPDYVRSFEAIYADLAARYGLAFYPFFLDGVAANPALNQHDGLHPTAAGVDAIVGLILPKVEDLLARLRERPPQQEHPERHPL
jgi:acyl-CoA thioesterase-1